MSEKPSDVFYGLFVMHFMHKLNNSSLIKKCKCEQMRYVCL